MKLLIVDDEAYVRDGIEKNIQWDTFGISEVRKAATGMEGLAIAREMKPDIIISDVRMPKMNGLKMADALIETVPRTKFIFISAYSELAYYKSAMKLHAVGFVEKPIILEELTQELQRAVELIAIESRGAQTKLSASEQENLLLLRLLHRVKGANNNVAIREALPEGSDLPGCLVMASRFTACTEEDLHTIRTEIKRFLPEDTQCLLAGLDGQYLVVWFSMAENSAKRVPLVADALIRHLPGGQIFVTCARAESAGQIAQAYEAAIKRQQYAFFYQKAHFDGMRNPRIIKEQPVLLPPELMKNVYTYVEEGNMAVLERILEAAIKQVDRPLDYSPEQVRFAFLHLLNVIRDAFIRVGIAESAINGGLYRQEQVTAFDSFTELSRFVKTEFKNMQNSLEEMTRSGRSIYWLKKEITENYADPDFSIAKLARKYHFSGNYLGNLFKRHTGMTIGQYLYETRMEHAKQLLRDPANKVSEVGPLVGMTNLDYFTKRFKQFTGKTPSEYRR